MNLLFFLTPKQDVAFIYDDFTLRQTLEKMEYHRYSCIPVLSRDGSYVGTITEGDLLWGIRHMVGLSVEQSEKIIISSIARRRDYKPVPVTTTMDELLQAAMVQNFVPVIDDKQSFIGLIKRQDIIRYCYDQYRESAACCAAAAAPSAGRTLQPK